MESLLNIAAQEGVIQSCLAALERQLLCQNIEFAFLEPSISDIYNNVVACISPHHHACPNFQTLISNISLFAYLKIGHYIKKLSIAVGALIIYFELEGSLNNCATVVSLVESCLGPDFEWYRNDIVQVRKFFLDNLSNITDDDRLIERVNLLSSTALCL